MGERALGTISMIVPYIKICSWIKLLMSLYKQLLVFAALVKKGDSYIVVMTLLSIPVCPGIKDT